MDGDKLTKSDHAPSPVMHIYATGTGGFGFFLTIAAPDMTIVQVTFDIF